MKPLQLPFANGLHFTPDETAGILTLLFQVGFLQLTDSDRQFARNLLLKAAMTYPQYANCPNSKKSKGFSLLSIYDKHPLGTNRTG